MIDAGVMNAGAVAEVLGGVSTEALRMRASAIEKDLLARKAVTPAELEALVPGGAENGDTGADGWLAYLIQLQRRHALAVDREHGGAGSASTLRLDDVLAAAACDQAEEIILHDGSHRVVFPKSYHALRWLDSLDRQLAMTGECLVTATALELPEEYRVAALAPLLESLAVRLWLWVLTFDGPGLPFDDDDQDPEPPAWTKEVSPDDLLRFYQAHLRVNVERLAMIARAFPAETGGGAPSRLRLAGFVSAASQELGVSPRDLARRWSLGNLFVQSVAAAQAAREAHARADAKRASRET